MLSRSKWIGGGVIAFVVGSLVFGVWLWLAQPPIPAAITKQMDFFALVPKEGSFSLDKSTVRYSSESEILTFIAKGEGVALTVTEQAVPSVMASFPDMLSRQFDIMKDKQTLVTPLGTAYVANNQDAKNTQVAAINAQGTLLFARPDHEMDTKQWRRFFNGLGLFKH